MNDGASDVDRRVLLVAPTQRDAEVTRALLATENIACHICRDLLHLTTELRAGAGAILLTNEILGAQGIAELVAALQAQPSWSDLPVILLMPGAVHSAAASPVLQSLGNVILLERPAPMRTLQSAVLAAVRSRDRQYQTREHIEALSRAEARARLLQEQFQAMANSIPQLAWMARPDGWIFWYNQRWYDFTGSSPQQMEGWGWQSVHDPKELPRVLESWRRAIQTSTAWQDTFPLRRYDGQYRWHLSGAAPYCDESGNIILWFGTNTDISDERRRAEEREQLLQSERAARADAERAGRMKDEFLATLSHELRTPLNAILGWSQLITGADDKPTIEEGISVIQRNARAQVQLIEDLLDMSRIISGKIRLNMQRIDAASCIKTAIETVTPAAEAKGVKLQSFLPPNIPLISGDPARLQQIVWNLLSNAIKFTPRDGHVQIQLAQESGGVVIRVSDTGQGIKADFLPHVFERFRQADASTTRAHGGLGLGLAIVKHLTELHGGVIDAASDGPDRGSTFTVTLPVPALQTLPLVPQPPSDPLHSDCAAGNSSALLKGLTVLVVDDEPDARSLIRRLLEDCDVNVLTAASAAEALEVFLHRPPDVLVSDIGMPVMDGYELLRQVRSLGPAKGGSVPAIALTAFARSEDRSRALLAGYHVHVAKPVEPQQLLATIASVAGRTRAATP